ncbi:hypothetical protein A3F66_06870 [candidate division TM6 bacterium RIFCSPHIGHO2_12_FULL_32_22]|nr:MAG: hypothetical protein A3F66_06870 [candidate division TM6 bacterium RIFCSPHIGHO2_12_FULL_32_22]
MKKYILLLALISFYTNAAEPSLRDIISSILIASESTRNSDQPGLASLPDDATNEIIKQIILDKIYRFQLTDDDIQIIRALNLLLPDIDEALNNPYTPSQEAALIEFIHDFWNAPYTEKFLNTEDYADEFNLTPRALRPYLYERLDKLQRYFPGLQLEDIFKLRFHGKTIEEHLEDAGYEGSLI